MELERVRVSRLKNWKFWAMAIGVIIVLSIFYNMGNSNAQIDLGKEKVSYDKLLTKISDKEKELKSLKEETNDAQGKLDDVNKQYSDKQSEFDEAMKVVSNKKTVEDEIVKLSSTVDSKNGEIKKLDSSINKKKGELASITGEIQEKKDAPKILSAGKYTVGKDIPSGRYKAVPNRGSGNFFINDGADANIMLGKGDFFQSEYVFEVIEGDEIDINLSVKFIPVK
jgi:uncharacterized protein YlxW (UPF0749 family)